MNNKSKMMNINTGEKTWLTPKYIIDALGPFDIDPCCPSDMPWRTASCMVCRPNDGLAIDWNNKRVWLNPPYGRESIPFLKKMINRQGGGYAFLFCRTDTIAWHTIISPYAYGMLFMKGRVRFFRSDGTQGDSAPAPSVIIAYTKDDYDRFNECGIEGFLVRIAH